MLHLLQACHLQSNSAACLFCVGLCCCQEYVTPLKLHIVSGFNLCCTAMIILLDSYKCGLLDGQCSEDCCKCEAGWALQQGCFSQQLVTVLQNFPAQRQIVQLDVQCNLDA